MTTGYDGGSFPPPPPMSPISTEPPGSDPNERRGFSGFIRGRNSVPPGASAEGTVPFLVPTEDVGSVVLYVEDLAFNTHSTFMAVH